MPYSITDLEILAGLLEGKTLGQIARDVYVGQPAVTRSLQALRQKIGFPIVEQQGRRVILTPGGRVIAQSALDLLQRHRDLERQVLDLHQGRSGPLNVVATTTPSSFLLPYVVGSLLRQVPGVQVNLRMSPPEEIWHVFTAERFDLGIGPPAVAQGPWTIEELYLDELVFFVAPASPYVGLPSVSSRDLARETFIGPVSAQYFEKAMEVYLRQMRWIDVRAAEAAKLLVEASGGIGMLLRSAIRRELQEGRFVELTIQDVRVAQPFWLGRRTASTVLPVVRQFELLLRERVRQLYADVEQPLR